MLPHSSCFNARAASPACTVSQAMQPQAGASWPPRLHHMQLLPQMQQQKLRRRLAQAMAVSLQWAGTAALGFRTSRCAGCKCPDSGAISSPRAMRQIASCCVCVAAQTCMADSSLTALVHSSEAGKQTSIPLLQGRADGGESLVGQTFSVQGWVRTVRNQKKFAFLEVSCKCTVLQSRTFCGTKNHRQHPESRLPGNAPHCLICTPAACSILLAFQPGPLNKGDRSRLASANACWVCSCCRLSLSARPCSDAAAGQQFYTGRFGSPPALVPRLDVSCPLVGLQSLLQT